jgi:PKD repeat protein
LSFDRNSGTIQITGGFKKMKWQLRFLLASLLLAGACSEDNGTGDGVPTINSFQPASVARGQSDVQGVITGTNFNGVVSVNLGSSITIQDTTGVSATEIHVRFSVSPNAQAGPQTITVSNLKGQATSTAMLSIEDNRLPIASFSVNPSQGSINTEITFDGRSSHDPDGKIKTYQWEFGDGAQASGGLVVHKFQSAGTFSTKLTVTDNKGIANSLSKDILIDNNRPPVAHYNFTPQKGTVNTTFEFDGTSSTDGDGRIIRYIWDFKDGTQKQGDKVKHKFTESGSFNVKLTVFDNHEAQGFIEKDLRVAGLPPIAKFSVSPFSGDTSTVFRFDASNSEDPDGRIEDYLWKFSDHSEDSGKIVEHRFSSEGSFNVTLTVVDNDRMRNETSRTISVHDNNPPPPDPDPDPPPSGGGEVCKTPAKDRGLIFGTIIDVEGPNAIIRLPEGSTCANSFYMCGDMRRASPEQFRGIIKKMEDRGGNVFSVFNDCPFKWPPEIGERDFLYYKRCSENYCP